MKLRSAIESDLQQIEVILKQSCLPYEDCSEHLDNFLIAEDEDKIIGVGGIELYGALALLRSMVVIEEYRGQHVGDIIFSEIRAKALSLGISELYLLTETAEEYFRRRNFSAIDRDLAPKEIQQTKQFSKYCQKSARVMKYVL